MVGRNVRVKFILRESERGLQARSGGRGEGACMHTVSREAGICAHPNYYVEMIKNTNKY